MSIPIRLHIQNEDSCRTQSQLQVFAAPAALYCDEKSSTVYKFDERFSS
jgi:hypothetical protein